MKLKAFFRSIFSTVKLNCISDDQLGKNASPAMVDNILDKITGYKYSLYTGILQRDERDIDIHTLCKKLDDFIIWGGSVPVSFHSKHCVPSQDISEIVSSISKNPLLEIVYIENGVDDKWPRYLRSKKEFFDNRSPNKKCD